MTVRQYEENDLQAMITIWNDVVEDGVAFPDGTYENICPYYHEL